MPTLLKPPPPLLVVTSEILVILVTSEALPLHHPLMGTQLSGTSLALAPPLQPAVAMEAPSVTLLLLHLQLPPVVVAVILEISEISQAAAPPPVAARRCAGGS